MKTQTVKVRVGSELVQLDLPNASGFRVTSVNGESLHEFPTFGEAFCFARSVRMHRGIECSIQPLA